MINEIFNKVLWFVGLVLLQVLFLNKMTVAGIATPLPYIYLLIIFNRNTPRWVLLLVGFILGLTMDSYTNLSGIHAAACVVLAMVQPVYMDLFIPRELQDERSLAPSVNTLRWMGFLKFVFICVLTHHFILIMLVFFSINDVMGIVMRVVGCTLLSMLVISIFAMLGVRKRN